MLSSSNLSSELFDSVFRCPACLCLPSSFGSPSRYENTYPQDIVIKWVYGEYPIPQPVVRLTATLAAIRCLATQTGATYDDLSTFSVPHFSGSIGQAYVNIREAMNMLVTEANRLIAKIVSYPIVV